MPSNYVILEQGMYTQININKTQPQVIYVAVPLLTCFGILFRRDEKAILYHAPSGIPSEGVLNEISKFLSSNKSDLEKIEITIALSDTAGKAHNTLNECLKILRQANFTNKPIIKEKQHCYTMDSLGNDAEVITPKKTREESLFSSNFFKKSLHQMSVNDFYASWDWIKQKMGKI